MPNRQILIDTHTFLWMAAEPERLSARARRVCAEDNLTLSVASIWEIGIKFQLGRLPLPSTPETYIAQQVRYAGITILPIHYAHALAAAAFRGIHKDPFDRMLAAQCIVEKMACVTKDKNLAGFGLQVVW
jgi:PIN domain nuclease of toxin-antitoxin system